MPRYSEILVERMATIISKMNGIAISRVSSPESRSSPPNLEAGNEIGREMRERHAEFGEAADPLVCVNEFQNSFP